MTTTSANAVLRWSIAPALPAPVLDPRLLDYLRPRMNADVIAQQLTDTPDGQGGYDRTWAQLFRTNAAIEALTGAEALSQGAIAENVTHRILIEYRTGVPPTLRLLYGKRIFDVKSVIDYAEQHLILELMSEEKFAA